MNTVIEPTRLEAIRAAKEQLGGDPELFIFVCHGPPWCDVNQSADPSACPWCHVINGATPRSPEQIEIDIEAQERGH